MSFVIIWVNLKNGGFAIGSKKFSTVNPKKVHFGFQFAKAFKPVVIKVKKDYVG